MVLTPTICSSMQHRLFYCLRQASSSQEIPAISFPARKQGSVNGSRSTLWKTVWRHILAPTSTPDFPISSESWQLSRQGSKLDHHSAKELLLSDSVVPACLNLSGLTGTKKEC